VPKRDESYMQAQRDSIARAALRVLVEKGFYETSLRDICQAAGVSNGALYSYFPTRESVVVAACAIDHAQQIDSGLPNGWSDYVEIDPTAETSPGTYQSKRFRLSLQFVAEISQMTDNPEGLTAIYHTARDNVRRALLRMYERGIIALPYGIEQTAEMHMQLLAGVRYQFGSNKSVQHKPTLEAFRVMMALTAGLIEESLST
jgi:AcrR family transcriptional regulator